jgi:hypothetical protein
MSAIPYHGGLKDQHAFVILVLSSHKESDARLHIEEPIGGFIWPKRYPYCDVKVSFVIRHGFRFEGSGRNWYKSTHSGRKRTTRRAWNVDGMNRIESNESIIPNTS